ncbi:MAG: hypothetical protein J7J67_01595 [Thermoproteales archaeon]|nr:hypothetical protein [Thermoproteales archaeon]
MSQSTPSSQITDKQMLDQGARLAVLARMGRVEVSQINQLIEVINSLGASRESLLYLAAFVSRQASRRAISRDFGRELKNLLLQYYNSGLGRDEARRLLGIVKWLYEALSGVRVDFKTLQRARTIEDVLKLI